MGSVSPLAFTYSKQPHVRRHGPAGYTDSRSFRPWLRDEFTFRCAYCLVRERWGKYTGEFDLEHFQSVSNDPDGKLDYDRLVYACHTCNLRKGRRSLADPSQAFVQSTIRVYLNGHVTGLSDEAKRIIAVLGMNSPKSVHWRLTWMRIIDLSARHEPSLFASLMCYPLDLPDLQRLQASANTRPEGVTRSWHSKRKRGELPDAYIE